MWQRGHVGHGGGWPAPIVHLSSDARTAGASPGTAAVAPFPRRRRTWHEPRALLSIRGGAARPAHSSGVSAPCVLYYTLPAPRTTCISARLLPATTAHHPPAATLQRREHLSLIAEFPVLRVYGAGFLVAASHKVANNLSSYSHCRRLKCKFTDTMRNYYCARGAKMSAGPLLKSPS